MDISQADLPEEMFVTLFPPSGNEEQQIEEISAKVIIFDQFFDDCLEAPCVIIFIIIMIFIFFRNIHTRRMQVRKLQGMSVCFIWLY